jgi:hypothetical protein
MHLDEVLGVLADLTEAKLRRLGRRRLGCRRVGW